MSEALVRQWLDRAAGLSGPSGMAAVHEGVEALRSGLDTPGLRVVAVGQGRAAAAIVINRLLGRELLSESSISGGSAAAVEVTSADRDSFTIGPDEAPQPLDEGWRESVVRAPAGHTVRVGVAEPRLATGRVRLVAAPSLDRTAVVRLADAVIVVTAATTPMSMGDLELLRDVLAYVPADCVTVAVSHMENLRDSDREDVLAYIHGRVDDAAAGVPVRLLPPMTAAADTGLWAWIEGVGERDRARARAERAALQLRASVEEILGTAREGERAARQAAADRAAAALAAASTIAEESSHFDQWRLELRDRQSALGRRFRDHVEDTRGALVERLQGHVRAATDPRRWWQDELPGLLRAELTRLADDFGATLRHSVEADLNWLDGNLFRKFGGHLELKDDTGVSLTVHEPVVSTEGLPDLRQRRMLLRFGPAGVAMVGAILVPGIGVPLAVGAGIGGWAVGEMMWRNVLDGQRRRIASRLAKIVDQATEDFAVEVTERLSDVYDGMADEAVRLRDEYRARRRTELAPVAPAAADPDWAALARDAEQLQREISAATGPLAGAPTSKGAGR